MKSWVASPKLNKLESNNQQPVQYEKGGPSVITTTQLFQFLGNKIGTQGCAKF